MNNAGGAAWVICSGMAYQFYSNVAPYSVTAPDWPSVGLLEKVSPSLRRVKTESWPSDSPFHGGVVGRACRDREESAEEAEPSIVVGEELTEWEELRQGRQHLGLKASEGVVAGVQSQVGSQGIAIPGAGVIEEVRDGNPGRHGGVGQCEVVQEGVDRGVEG